MTITEHKLKSDAFEGEGRDEATEVRSFTLGYQLISDDATDTYAEARAYLKANSSLPWYGRRWKVGTRGDSQATCRSISITRNHTTFDVRATYNTQSERNQEKPDTNGEPTTDPLRWRPELDISYAQTSVAIEAAEFTGFSRPVGNPFLLPGRRGPPVNSALQPFELQYMREQSVQVFRCTFNREEWDQAEGAKYIDRVNNAPFRVLIPSCNFNVFFPIRQCKVRQYGGRSMFTNGVKYWAITIEMAINPDGWRLQLLDRGFGVRMRPGDQKQNIHPADAETWSSVEVLQFGNLPAAHVMGPNDEPMAVPGLLNGNGQLLTPNEPPVYLEYKIYEEISFATLFALASV